MKTGHGSTSWRFTAKSIIPQRLAGQSLTGSRARTASDVVLALGAVQAQDYADASWALALRTRGVRAAAVESELSEGSILRTHVLRPTWHFVSPQDIRWLLSLTGPRVQAANAYRYRQLALDNAVLRKSRDVLTKELSGGKCLTRRELSESLRRAGIADDLPNRHGHILMHAELDAVISSGARRGKQFTYALLEERVPPAPAIERDEALLRLAQRYFATRGPAKVQDFCWWSGLAMADVRRAIDIAGKELEQQTVAGEVYWLIAAGRRLPQESDSAHLLPAYDEYFIAYRDRSAIGPHFANVLRARYVFVNGQMIARWQRTFEQDRAIVDVEPLEQISAADALSIERAARRYGAFLGMPVELRGL